MPNTLAHAGVQGFASRAALPDADLKWVYLACVIPDCPWILQRAAHVMMPGVDPYLLRSYVIIQASLLGCVVLSAAVALVARRTWTVLAILGGNAVLHLGLDAMQTKWGNGVHFFAPLSWDIMNLGLFWPESFLTHVLTTLGLVHIIWNWRPSVSEPLGFSQPSTLRLTGTTALLLCYFAIPFLLLQQPIETNTHHLRTLSTPQDRRGSYVELDRVRYVSTREGEFLKYYGGSQRVQVEGLDVKPPATVSIRGVFIDQNKVRPVDIHVHSEVVREYNSYIGIMLVFALMALSCKKQ